MHLGVSDPVRAAPGAKSGAAKRGSLTPHVPPKAVATDAPVETGRHKRRPLTVVEVAHCQDLRRC